MLNYCPPPLPFSFFSPLDLFVYTFGSRKFFFSSSRWKLDENKNRQINKRMLYSDCSSASAPVFVVSSSFSSCSSSSVWSSHEVVRGTVSGEEGVAWLLSVWWPLDAESLIKKVTINVHLKNVLAIKDSLREVLEAPAGTVTRVSGVKVFHPLPSSLSPCHTQTQATLFLW